MTTIKGPGGTTEMLIRLIEKEELIFCSDPPYDALRFLPSEGKYIAVFDDFGTVQERGPELLGRLLLRRGCC